MELYLLDADADRYAGLVSTDQDAVNNWDTILRGEKHADSWSPLEVDTYMPPKGKQGDFCVLAGMRSVCVTQECYQIVGPHLTREVEFLPLVSRGTRYYIVNVTNIVDCLDVAHTEAVYSSTTPGKMLSISKYAVDSEMLTDTLLFKIPQRNAYDVFCTAHFKALVERQGLEGLIFQKVALAATR